MSILPGIAEISRGIDVYGKPLKTRLRTVFSYLKCLQKLIKIIIIGRKKCRCQPAVFLLIYATLKSS